MPRKPVAEEVRREQISQSEAVRETKKNEAQEVSERASEVLTEEQEFLQYVRTELAVVAKGLGYEVSVRKVNTPVPGMGTVTMFNPDTMEGEIFSNESDAPPGYLTGDQWQAEMERRRAG